MNIIIVPSIILFILEFTLFLRRPLSAFRFLMFCYVTIVGLGVPMVLLIDAISGYKFKLRDLDTIQSLFVSGYALLYVGAFPAFAGGRLFRDRYKERLTRLSDFSSRPLSQSHKAGLTFLLILSLFAALIYLATTGLSFGDSGYESRYEAASGSGPLLLLIPAFLPFAAYRLSVARSAKSFVLMVIILLAYNFFIFIMLSGYRQLLIASALLSMIIAVDRGIVPRWTIVPSALFVFPLIALSMSFARYSGESENQFSDNTTAALYYIQGDIFPIDAPMRIMWHCEQQRCPGVSTFVSHLEKFVPRALWPSKPRILPDAAGYYTKTVLNYSRNLTLSVTILGEALFMNTTAGFCLVFILSGFSAGILTTIFSVARPSISYCIYLANIYIGFFWVREGFEDAINRMIIMAIYAVIGTLSGLLYVSLAGKRYRIAWR